MGKHVTLDSSCLFRPWTLIAFSIIAAATAHAQQSGSFNSLMSNAESALSRGDNEKAIAAIEKLLKDDSDQLAAVRLAGDVYLRTGHYREAVRWFDKAVQQQPSSLPYLWQRGIALYFAGDYRAGAKQFEVHRRVNPNDVENAAWHFLCVAKAESFDRAKKMVLPAPGDPRLPMAEVLEMLRTGDTRSVLNRIEGQPAGTSQREQAEFYGYFYLGLYADAQGETSTALQHLKKSASQAPHHYMGDVARVYVEYLEKSRTNEGDAEKRGEEDVE